MYYYISQIDNQPTIYRFAFYPWIQIEIFLGCLPDGIRERFEHPVACPIANNKIIGKAGNVLYVDQKNIFSLFILKRGDHIPRQIQ